MIKWSCRCKWDKGIFYIDMLLREKNRVSYAVEEIDFWLDKLMHQKSVSRWKAKTDAQKSISIEGLTFWNFRYGNRRKLSLGLYLVEAQDPQLAITEMKKKMLDYLYSPDSNQWDAFH